MPHINEPYLTILWSMPNGIRCVPLPYDEDRLQLKLISDQGTINLEMLFRDSGSSSRRYLVYLNRTWVDDVRALWQSFVEHRIKSQAGRVFSGVRERIEVNARRRTSESSIPRQNR
jgi:hypothetical protein